MSFIERVLAIEEEADRRKCLRQGMSFFVHHLSVFPFVAGQGNNDSFKQNSEIYSYVVKQLCLTDFPHVANTDDFVDELFEETYGVPLLENYCGKPLRERCPGCCQKEYTNDVCLYAGLEKRFTNILSVSLIARCCQCPNGIYPYANTLFIRRTMMQLIKRNHLAEAYVLWLYTVLMNEVFDGGKQQGGQAFFNEAYLRACYKNHLSKLSDNFSQYNRRQINEAHFLKLMKKIFSECSLLDDNQIVAQMADCTTKVLEDPSLSRSKAGLLVLPTQLAAPLPRDACYDLVFERSV